MNKYLPRNGCRKSHTSFQVTVGFEKFQIKDSKESTEAFSLIVISFVLTRVPPNMLIYFTSHLIYCKESRKSRGNEKKSCELNNYIPTVVVDFHYRTHMLLMITT